MIAPKFEILEEDKEQVSDIISDTIETCFAFGFDPTIGRGVREAYRVGYERGYGRGLKGENV